MCEVVAFPISRTFTYRRRPRAWEDLAYETFEGRVMPFIDPVKEEKRFESDLHGMEHSS